jgi:hypothetical protein
MHDVGRVIAGIAGRRARRASSAAKPTIAVGVGWGAIVVRLQRGGRPLRVGGPLRVMDRLRIGAIPCLRNWLRKQTIPAAGPDDCHLPHNHGWRDLLFMSYGQCSTPTLLLEINCADDAHDNQGPIAQVLYGFSLLYCMTSSLAHGGAGLGTCGLPESRIRALAVEAGFRTVTRVAENPFNVLYALTN